MGSASKRQVFEGRLGFTRGLIPILLSDDGLVIPFKKPLDGKRVRITIEVLEDGEEREQG